MLTHHMLKNGMTPVEAARETVAKLEGAFALCFLFQGEEDLLIVARKGSPLLSDMGTMKCSWGQMRLHWHL